MGVSRLVWRAPRRLLFAAGLAAAATALHGARPPTGRDGVRGPRLHGLVVPRLETVRCDQQELIEEQELVPGIRYRDSLDGDEKLVGAGMRRMTPLKIKVYAIGLYMDRRAMEQQLGAYRGATAEGLYDDAGFWRKVCSTDVDKTIVMIVARTVTGKHLQQGFDRAMLKRVRALAKEGMPGGKQALKELNTRLVEMGTFEEGDEIRFDFKVGGRLVLHLAGREPVLIENGALCLAFAEMFLGERAASPEAKLEFARGFVSVLG